jgi:prolyl-tRNA synthetase
MIAIFGIIPNRQPGVLPLCVQCYWLIVLGMRQSQLFTQTTKQPPADEQSKNAKLLRQAGFIHKEAAGVYSFLPLGLRTRNNIESIIREEMESVGGQELNLTALQPDTQWVKTDRWSDEAIDVWFKTQLKNGTELGLATTHEEPITAMLSHHVNSYRDLPVAAYQFQTKFRNELRAKAGIMRGREFLMKDLYSFSRTEDEHESFYQDMKEAYERIFARVGIGDKTVYTYADGGSFSDFSHEFQTESQAGEDTIYIDRKENIAVNEEVLNDEVLDDLGLKRNQLEEVPAIEVGNIFPLGTKFSEPLDLTYTDENGKEQPVIMGSYGIGVGRLMGAITEVMAGDDGLLWPESVAPFTVHLLQLGDAQEVETEARTAYKTLQGTGIDVLFDDRSVSAGEKFADSDLFGLPVQVIVSQNTVDAGKLEVTFRPGDDSQMIALDQLISRLTDTNHES